MMLCVKQCSVSIRVFDLYVSLCSGYNACYAIYDCGQLFASITLGEGLLFVARRQMAAMSTQLTPGAIPLLHEGFREGDGAGPLLQVIELSLFSGAEEGGGARGPWMFLVLSDGEFYGVGMSTEQITNVVEGPPGGPPMQQWATVQLVKWSTVNKEGRDIIYIYDMQVIQNNEEAIGSAQQYERASAAEPAAGIASAASSGAQESSNSWP